MELNAFDPDGVGVDNGTYFGLPFEPGTAELVLVSAPWDVTVSYGAGTAHAPDAVIEASTQLDFHEPLAPGNSISETEKKSKFTDVIGRYYIGTKDVDFNNRIIYDNGIAIPKQYEPDFRLAPNNSILMCIEGGSAGRKIAILNQDVCFGNKLCCFSPFVGIGKYMYYYLQSPSFFELFNLNKTGIIGGVSIAKVKEILIPLPPIKEQQRIVAQIEKLFEQLR